MSLLNYWKTRGLLMGSAVLTVAAGVYLSSAMGFPAPGVWHVSALLQPSPGVALGALAAVLALGIGVGTALAGRVRGEAGLMVGCLGWAALSWRSGSIAQALFTAPEAGTYVRFAMELAALGVLLVIGQAVVVMMRAQGALKADKKLDGIELDAAHPAQVAIAMAATAGVYLVLTYFLLASIEKQQSIWGCAVAGWIAASAVHYFMGVDLPVWSLWPGVLIGAAGAYVYAGVSAPGVPGIAFVPFPPARALPLDHASAGVAAAIFGYWDARRWRRPNTVVESSASATSRSSSASSTRGPAETMPLG